jgi:hypothetical protein
VEAHWVEAQHVVVCFGMCGEAARPGILTHPNWHEVLLAFTQSTPCGLATSRCGGYVQERGAGGLGSAAPAAEGVGAERLLLGRLYGVCRSGRT